MDPPSHHHHVFSPALRWASPGPGHNNGVRSTAVSRLPYAPAAPSLSIPASPPAGLTRSSTMNAGNNDAVAGEVALCERLTKRIKYHRSLTAASPTAPSSSLSAILEETCTAVEYYAKWFTPAGLKTLLEIALDAAMQSSASADFFSALKIIDKICTFASVPDLLPVTRFIAYTYYQGSRENRHRKLLISAWRVAQIILRTHLAPQFINLLLQTVSNRQSLQSRVGMAAGRGSLMMVLEILQLDIAQEMQTTEPTQLLLALEQTPLDGDVVLAEQLLSMIVWMLQDEVAMAKLETDGSLALCLRIGRCAIANSSDLDVLESIYTVLELQSLRFEAQEQHDIAILFVEHRRPLPPALSSQLIAQWRRSLLLEEEVGFTNSRRTLLDRLSTCSFHITELKAFVQICVDQYPRMTGSSQLDLVLTMESLITAYSTVEPAVEVLGAGLTNLFIDALEQKTNPDEVQAFFRRLCSLSKHCIVIASLLLSIRVDAAGGFYLRLDPDASSEAENTGSRRLIECNVPLPMESWTDAIDGFMAGDVLKWDVYDRFLTSLPHQLQNHALWATERHHVRHMLQKTCVLLKADLFREPPTETGLNKSHVVSHLIQLLTAMMSYHSELLTNDIKTAIITVINVAGSRDHSVSIQCIHTLSICCYERPQLMATFMDAVIDKMSKLVTQKSLAIYVLEFLAGLSRLPLLHEGLRLEDFKRIFGVCYSYLQSIRITGLMERKQTPSSGRSTNDSSSSNDEMAQYVYALAHHVIIYWYVSLRKQVRQALKLYITSCLQYTDADQREIIEDQGLVTIDLMDRIDAEEPITSSLEDIFDDRDGPPVTHHRLAGLLLITTETALRTGKTLITIRRPSGTSRRMVHRPPSLYSATSDGAESVISAPITVESDEQDFLAVFPNDVAGLTYGRIAIPRSASALGSNEIVNLPNDEDSVKRAIQVFDKVSALDSHKAGIIYVGEGQTGENQILSNTSGSPDYRDFLGDIGSLRRLKDAQFNSQGLDRMLDLDGEHTIVWNNDVTELVYHITTFMPNRKDDEHETMIKKKAHIGNDFVNIIFNNSGGEFRFDTFPSAFNYVYIVICPSERTSYIQARTITVRQEKKDRFYTVHVMSRPGFPSLSSAGEVKVVSGTSLGAYVRNLALNACVFSLMWNKGEDYESSWRLRLNKIRRLYQQHGSRLA